MLRNEYDHPVFIWEQGDVEKWRKEVDKNANALTDSIRIPGNRRLTGKMSVFANRDLVQLILLYATPQTFNYTVEDVPFTMVFNPYPKGCLEFYDNVEIFESGKEYVAGLSKIFDYKTGAYFSAYLSTSYVAIRAIDFIKYAFKVLREGWKNGISGISMEGHAYIALVVMSFTHGGGLHSFSCHYFEDAEAQVMFVEEELDKNCFCVVFTKTRTLGWGVEHFFSRTVRDYHEDDEFEAEVQVLSNERFEKIKQL